MDDAALELTGLLDEANRVRQSIPELADTDAFTDRTVYYYSQQGLLPRASRRRGPGTTYPTDFVDRLLFIRRLQKEQSLTLAHIREVMEKVTSQTIHDVARGREPLEIRVAGGYEPEDLDVHRQVLALNSPDVPTRSREQLLTFNKRTGIKRVARVANVAQNRRDNAEDRDGPTARYSIGRGAELQIHRSLTSLQEKRVEQVVGLLRSILDEDDNT